MCDGDNDCGDNFDEQNCTGIPATTPLPCSKDSFRCANGQGCVPNSWRCDGESDCLDNSDEDNCNVKCPADSFECSDGSCIPMMWKVEISRLLINQSINQPVNVLLSLLLIQSINQWINQ